MTIIGNVLVLIVWVAIIGKILSSKSRTSKVVTSMGNAFSNALQAAKN